MNEILPTGFLKQLITKFHLEYEYSRDFFTYCIYKILEDNPSSLPRLKAIMFLITQIIPEKFEGMGDPSDPEVNDLLQSLEKDLKAGKKHANQRGAKIINYPGKKKRIKISISGIQHGTVKKKSINCLRKSKNINFFLNYFNNTIHS